MLRAEVSLKVGNIVFDYLDIMRLAREMCYDVCEFLEFQSLKIDTALEQANQWLHMAQTGRLVQGPNEGRIPVLKVKVLANLLNNFGFCTWRIRGRISKPINGRYTWERQYMRHYRVNIVVPYRSLVLSLPRVQAVVTPAIPVAAPQVVDIRLVPRNLTDLVHGQTELEHIQAHWERH